MTAFKTDNQERLYRGVLRSLVGLGYSGSLLEEGYSFGDWFVRNIPERKIAAAAFGQTPVSYDTALFGVALAGGNSGYELVSQYRALGAPIVFAVGDTDIEQWSMGVDEKTTRLQKRFDGNRLASYFTENAGNWKPGVLLRTKNVESVRWEHQQSLFAGLIPELESKISGHLDPLLKMAVKSASTVYRRTTGERPDEGDLFKAIFGLLTGKVFSDRSHEEFKGLDTLCGPDEVLSRVQKHYRERWPKLLNRDARQAAFDHIWSKMDFRNLSVDVLSHVWSRTLVTGALRKRLGIHRTPRSIVRYIIENLPFSKADVKDRVVVEPCCGSAVFLVGALNRLRDLLDKDVGPQERHEYFKSMLHGFEKDPFGTEISKLCLALSDYPNANGWNVTQSDVLTSKRFATAMSTARFVVCNPPFESFSDEERIEYSGHPLHKPAAIIDRVLDSLHPEGVLGFVLPRAFVDGRGYKSVRNRIAKRFGRVEIVNIPDRAWEHGTPETVVLLATDPNLNVGQSLVLHRKVRERGWRRFNLYHRFSSTASCLKTATQAERSLLVPELKAVWKYLKNSDTLKSIAEIHRGIEWNKPLTEKGKETGWRELLIRTHEFKHSKLGIPSQPGDFFAFERPRTAFLDVSAEHRRGNAHDYPWNKPKVILNAVTKSRSYWRIAAFIDTNGLVVYQNLTAAWPHDPEDLAVVSAILNGPLANVFVTAHEGKTHLKNATLKAIPVPAITPVLRDRVNSLVAEYAESREGSDPNRLFAADDSASDRILRELDAVVLKAYDLPQKLERAVLDRASLGNRIVPFKFNRYFPKGFRPYLSLSEYLAGNYRLATVGEFLRRSDSPPPSFIVDAMKAASEGDL
jgi:hypothetical protein